LCCTKGANCGCCACCLANCWVFCPSPAKCKHIALSAALFVLASGALVYTSTASSVVLWRKTNCKQQPCHRRFFWILPSLLIRSLIASLSRPCRARNCWNG